MRAVVSVPPPGSKPTTVLMALAGHCAAAAALSTIPMTAKPILILMVISL